ncbi:hypothetical protein GCM10009610_33840 [Pseudonocardia xinjiangensis]
MRRRRACSSWKDGAASVMTGGVVDIAAASWQSRRRDSAQRNVLVAIIVLPSAACTQHLASQQGKCHLPHGRSALSRAAGAVLI